MGIQQKIIKAIQYLVLLCIPLTFIMNSGLAYTSILENEPWSLGYKEVKLFPTMWVFDGQEIEVVDESYSVGKETLEKFSDGITIENKIPEDATNTTVLLIRTSQQTLQVFVEQELIYEYNPIPTQRFGKVAPSKWNFVELPANSAGKTIQVSFHSAIPKFAGNIRPVMYGTGFSLVTWVFTQYCIPFLLSILLLVLGVVIASLSFASKEITCMRYFGLFTICVSMWTISESRMLIFLPGTLAEWRLVNFQSVLLAPILYWRFLERIDFIRKDRIFKICKWLLRFNFVIQNFLFFFNVFDYIEMLPVTFMVMLCMIVLNNFYVYFLYRDQYEFRKLFKGFIPLMIMLSVSIIVEIYKYYFLSIGNTGYLFRSLLTIYIICILVLSTKAISERLSNSMRLSKELTDYRVAIAMSQIKPHFIFNTLTSIRALIKLNPDQAYDLVGMFAKYLRVNINAFDKPSLISFEDEVNHIKTYIDIEKIRFQGRISMEYDIKISNFSVPALSIQPLVENAVKHGICKKVDGGVIVLKTYPTYKYNVIEIIDNGAGFQLDHTENNGIGISNIKFRLKTMLDADVEITSDIGIGTKIKVIIPKEV